MIALLFLDCKPIIIIPRPNSLFPSSFMMIKKVKHLESLLAWGEIMLNYFSFSQPTCSCSTWSKLLLSTTTLIIICSRNRLENNSDHWNALLLSLRELSEWTISKEAELEAMGPIGGDEVTIRRQQVMCCCYY